MKIRANNVVDLTVPPQIMESLEQLRALRHFEAESWVEAKVLAISDYFYRSGLSGAVLGVSGGIDSALAAALLHRVQSLPDSPLKKVMLISLPSYSDEGATGQGEAVSRAQSLANSLGMPLHVVDMNPGLAPLRKQVSDAVEAPLGAWALGQGVAVMRTYMLYQSVSGLSQEGFPSLVIGTTNRDEGAYLGYVGKSGDGMVDLQIISDLHKSEVYEASRYLNIPETILNAVPTGDMFDACPDSDVFGAPYDAVELLILSRTMLTPQKWDEMKSHWDESTAAYWSQAEDNLEALHDYNSHKYMVGSPAVHLDILDSSMPGGWHPYSPTPYVPPNTVHHRFPAERVLPFGDRRDWVSFKSPAGVVKDVDSFNITIPGLFNGKALQELVKTFSDGPWVQSDEYGQWREESQAQDVLIGSYRSTVHDQALAHALWEGVRHHLPPFRVQKEGSKFFDEDVGTVWRPVAVNPVFRFMKYQGEGESLVAHYDGPFEVNHRYKSGMTLILYLDLADEGGQLRFIKDPQSSLPLSQCNLQDWTRSAHQDEVSRVPSLNAGDAVVFDHFQLHDSSPLKKGNKLLMRTDIFFEKVGV